MKRYGEFTTRLHRERRKAPDDIVKAIEMLKLYKPAVTDYYIAYIGKDYARKMGRDITPGSYINITGTTLTGNSRSLFDRSYRD